MAYSLTGLNSFESYYPLTNYCPFVSEPGLSLPAQGTNSQEPRMYFQGAGGTIHSPCSGRKSLVTAPLWWHTIPTRCPPAPRCLCS